MSAIGKLVAVTIDCPDPASLADFYENALGWEIIYSDENAAYLSDGGNVRVGFQRVDNFTAPAWPGQSTPQQMHLDIGVDDIDAAEQKLIDLGAKRADDQPGGESWRVMLDPAGHPFCVTTSH
jgi:catechol 2,3-dioxygenase-like lactoylglutathione lyase family enzyme